MSSSMDDEERLDEPDLDLDGPDRNTWCTPARIAQAIGEWDLDPCSNERSHIMAKRTFRLDRGQDGLALAKYVGRSVRVFINPPYSSGQVIQWVRAYRRTRFCWLVRLDTSTQWFLELEPFITEICVPRLERIEFEPPPGVEPSSNPYPHALLYARPEDITDAVRAMCYRWRPVR